MSHERDFQREPYVHTIEIVLKDFRLAFEGTSLSIDAALVRRLCCVNSINSFRVLGPMSLDRGRASPIGLALYLNASRFDHSRQADLLVDFDGARLIAHYRSDASEAAPLENERLSMVESPEKFNALTINYGYSFLFTGCGQCPLRYQRRASLQFHYFFTCHCALCDDERQANLEENAAAVECTRCNEPYLWQHSPSTRVAASVKSILRHNCQCPLDGDEQNIVRTFFEKLEPVTALRQLDEEWNKAIGALRRTRDAYEIALICGELLPQALRYWHRSSNLRLVQLNEFFFVAFGEVVLAAGSTTDPYDRDALDCILKSGEIACSWHEKRPLAANRSAAAVYAYHLAELYELSASTDQSNGDRAAFWYLHSATLWRIYGERSSELIQKLTSFAENMKQKVREAQTDEEQVKSK